MSFFRSDTRACVVCINCNTIARIMQYNFVQIIFKIQQMDHRSPVMFSFEAPVVFERYSVGVMSDSFLKTTEK